MNILCSTHCVIGKCPLWNEREQRLVFVDGMRFQQDGFSSLYVYSPATGRNRQHPRIKKRPPHPTFRG